MSTTEFKALMFGPFREAVKQKELVYTFAKPNPTVRDLLDRLVRDYPHLSEYLYEGQELSENTNIIINGEDVRGLGGFDLEIHPEDRITFFKAAGGG